MTHPNPTPQLPFPISGPLALPPGGAAFAETVEADRQVAEATLGLVVPRLLSDGAARLLGILVRDLEVIDLGTGEDARHHATLWIAWATHDHPEGGGLASSAEELAGLADDDLLEGVVEFLTWLASPVDPDHPLVGGSRVYGARSYSDPLRRAGVGHHARAFRAWCRSIGRPPVWTERDLVRMADLSQAPRSRRRAELTVEALTRCLNRLDAQDVVAIDDPARCRAWHAREKAALLVRIWGVLRAGEATQLRTHLETEPYGLRVRLHEPKTRRSRWVRLPSRGDRFCPVRALEEWLSAAHDGGFHLGDRLLPVVLQVQNRGAFVSLSGSTEARNTTAVFEAAGLVDELCGDGDEIMLGRHNFRSVLPTLAADAGHDLPFLQSLAAWRRGATPATSYVVSSGGLAEARAMADFDLDPA